MAPHTLTLPAVTGNPSLETAQRRRPRYPAAAATGLLSSINVRQDSLIVGIWREWRDAREAGLEAENRGSCSTDLWRRHDEALAKLEQIRSCSAIASAARLIVALVNADRAQLKHGLAWSFLLMIARDVRPALPRDMAVAMERAVTGMRVDL